MRAQGYAPKTRVLALQRNAAGLVGEDGAYRAQIGRFDEAVGETRLQILQLDRMTMEDTANRLRDIQVRLDDIRPRLAAARDQLAKSTVRAPTGGRVVGLTAFTVGGVVAPGQTVMEIVPQDRRLVIKARVSPADADDLKPGQHTQIRFSSIHDRALPLMTARSPAFRPTASSTSSRANRISRPRSPLPRKPWRGCENSREDASVCRRGYRPRC